MAIPKQIIDNSEGNKLISFLNLTLKEEPKTSIDIATAFFDIKAFAMLKDNLGGVEKFRLLLGKTPEFVSEKTLGEIIIQKVKEEVEDFDLLKENIDTITLFIKFLGKKNVDVRLYDNNFLHGKTYIFDDRIVIGSSNFTAAGLTREGELNNWMQESQAVYTRKEWFDKFWCQSIDFKEKLIQLLEESRFGSKEYTPFDVYIKTLYEFQKDELKEDRELQKAKGAGLPETKVNLAEFQEDAISRIMTRLNKYNGCIVADSVGLGKTWIAKKILEEIGYYKRRNFLVICPAQLREMWIRELKDIDLKENILSQEELASKDFLDKAKSTLKRINDVELVVIDESHNFRNPLANKWENLFTLLHDHLSSENHRPKMLFLTATPINNTPWDLYWQIMLITLMDKSAFAKESIPDLFKFFKDSAEKPELLNDLLNEISIRRTRDYIVKNYPDAYVINSQGAQEKIIFPERVLENINYELDKAYKGMYRGISKTISDDLKMAYYHFLDYKKEGVKSEFEIFLKNRMIQIGGIFRTIMLKRLESSVEAFRISINKHILFLEKLKQALNAGKILGKESFSKYFDEFQNISEEDIEDYLEDLEQTEGIKFMSFNKEDYNYQELITDINKDIELLKNIHKKVSTIKPEEDAKLNKLKEKLLQLSKDGQVVLFTYYADTLNYISNEIKNDKRFTKIVVEAVSSSGKTGKNSHEREKMIQDFFAKKIDVILSTDVLSEGQNLQTAKYLLNYDLHWNPTRMIQRAGRIDRIGSKYKQIFVYNFFPEDELEELLKLVEILQNKIVDIDASIGLDQTVLGEKIHPKVFGIIRRIKDKDQKIMKELEDDSFGGGEKFYQPLKDFLKSKPIEDLEKMPMGIHSGLKKNKINGMFFYYKYGQEMHFWRLYDVNENIVLSNKTQILEYIACPQKEARTIPDFFNKLYEINSKVLENIKLEYDDIQLSQTQDSRIKEMSRSRSTTFVKKIIDTTNKEIDEYLDEFPNDKEYATSWDSVEKRLINTPLTKKRIKDLRKIWSEYKSKKNWKQLIKNLDCYLVQRTIDKKKIEEFDKSKLKLVTVDIIS
ncbi:MAG: helicase-related protein [archaeon]